MTSSATMSMSTNSTRATVASNCTFVSHLSNISLKVVGVVVDMLDPAIWKIDRVMSLSGSCTIALLLLIKTGATVAVSDGIIVVVRNYLMDFVSISMSNSVTSMSNSVTSMSASMTSMSKTSMANARASMVTNRSMSSTEATDLGRGGSKEDRDANEDLHSVN